jgi:hypothetical protein
MHLLTFGENLMKIGLILSAQQRFSTKRQKGCPVTLRTANKGLTKANPSLIRALERNIRN